MVNLVSNPYCFSLSNITRYRPILRLLYILKFLKNLSHYRSPVNKINSNEKPRESRRQTKWPTLQSCSGWCERQRCNAQNVTRVPGEARDVATAQPADRINRCCLLHNAAILSPEQSITVSPLCCRWNKISREYFVYKSAMIREANVFCSADREFHRWLHFEGRLVWVVSIISTVGYSHLVTALFWR